MDREKRRDVLARKNYYSSYQDLCSSRQRAIDTLIDAEEEKRMEESIDPNKKKGWFFPNWFNKEHFEIFLGEKISDEEFEAWKEFLMDETNIFDAISNEVQGFLMLFKNEFKVWFKEKEGK